MNFTQILRPSLNFAVILVMGAGLLTGCSNELDTTKNVFPTDTVQETATGGALCSGCPSVGQMYRFDTLAVTELDHQINPVTDVLNPVWVNDIKLNELNIIFEVVETSADNIYFRAINAARVNTEGETCLMLNTAVDMKMSRDGCTLDSSEEASMNIYAGTENNPKTCAPGNSLHAINIQGVELAAELTEDCGQIINGNIVQAYLPKESLDNTCSCITTGTALSDEACLTPDPDFEDDNCGGCNTGFVALNTYLKAFSPGGKLDYACATDDEDPAVCLSGNFSLVRLESPIEACP